jgi:hypothetical protein
VNQRMARGASLDFPQSDEISPLEVAVAVLELPKWGVGRASVKDIANCECMSTFAKGISGFGAHIPLWKPYMFS